VEMLIGVEGFLRISLRDLRHGQHGGMANQKTGEKMRKRFLNFNIMLQKFT
jgi:hypothetical protein